jgi:intracellular septation protein
MAMTKPPRPWLKPSVDYVPLAIFLLTYLQMGLYAATAALMVAVTTGIILSYTLERTVPIMPLVTGGLVMVFGGLTLAFDDERFIKMKPTIVQTLFAIIMFGGLILDKPVLKPLFGKAWQLRDEGWRKLTLRFGIFFIIAGALNEVVWRTQTTDVWVSFKVFGLMGLTFMFMMSQVPMIKRYHIPEENGDASAD